MLAAWVAAGLLSLAGALTYAELGAMLPHAGGEYVYLRRSYGEAAAFLFGWMRFFVAGSGSIAILGTGFAIFLSAIVPWAASGPTRLHALRPEVHWQFGAKQAVAVGAILVFAALNCLAVAFGGRVQSILTVLKVAGIAVVVVGLPVVRDRDWSHLAARARRPPAAAAAFGLAMLAALWAYDGWNNMPMAAGEVKDPGRNMPLALIGGMVVVMVIYCAANLAYFYALPWGEVVTSNSTRHRDALPVATRAAQSAFGESGGKLMSIAFVLSALGALNGSTLTGARVPFAMARDGLFSWPASACSVRGPACRRGGPDAGRAGRACWPLGDLRSVDRLRRLRIVDFLRPGDIRRLRPEARARPRAALQDARLSCGAAGLRHGCRVARGQHADQPPNRVRRGPGAHRSWTACLLVLPRSEALRIGLPCLRIIEYSFLRQSTNHYNASPSTWPTSEWGSCVDAMRECHCVGIADGRDAERAGARASGLCS